MSFAYRHRKFSSILALASMLIATTAAPVAGEYDPKLGRWLQRDPIGTGVPLQPALAYHAANPTVSVSMAHELQYGDGMNFYEFVRSNAVNHTDPTGLFVGYQRFVADVTGSAIAAYAFGLDAAIYALSEEGPGGTGFDQAIEGIPIAVGASFVGGAIAWGLRWRPTGNILGSGVAGGITTFGMGEGFAPGAAAGLGFATMMEIGFHALGNWRTGAVVGSAASASRRGAGMWTLRALRGRGLLAICFPGDTLVAMADGSFKAIQEVSTGDCVLCADDPLVGDAEECQVTEVIKRRATELVTLQTGDGGRLQVTPEHPIWIAGQGWRASREIAAGDRVGGTSGGALEVCSVTTELHPDGLPVYNLEVVPYHTYYVTTDRILVHNQCDELGRILADRNLFRGWLRSVENTQRRLTQIELDRVLEAAKEHGIRVVIREADLIIGSRSGQWMFPHIQVDGLHIGLARGVRPK